MLNNEILHNLKYGLMNEVEPLIQENETLIATVTSISILACKKQQNTETIDTPA